MKFFNILVFILYFQSDVIQASGSADSSSIKHNITFFGNKKSLVESSVVNDAVEESNIITSANYPDFYPSQGNEEWNLISELGAGMDIYITVLDIDPSSDFLYIQAGVKGSASEKGILYSGTPAELPIHIRILHTNQCYIRFSSNNFDKNTKYKGFSLTYETYGETKTEVEITTTEFPINSMPVEFVTKYIIIPEENRTEATWSKLRDSLSTMTNNYINSANLSVEECKPDYVIFSSIKNCPVGWRKNENCIEIEFGIPVPMIINDVSNSIKTNNASKANSTYELSAENLNKMWDAYAYVTLTEIGIEIFRNTNTDVLLIWIGICLGVVVVFLIILFIIWKCDSLKDYKKMKNKPEEIYDETKTANEMDFDASMHPTIYQNTPPFFPNNEVLGFDLLQQTESEQHQSRFLHDINEDTNNTYVRRTENNSNKFRPESGYEGRGSVNGLTFDPTSTFIRPTPPVLVRGVSAEESHG